MHCIVVRMPWERISINKCYFVHRRTGRRMLRDRVKRWRQDLADEVAVAYHQLGRPGVQGDIWVRIDQFNPVRNDRDNLCKVIWDGVKLGLGTDDRHFRADTGDVWEYRAMENAHVIITIRWGGNGDAQVGQEGVALAGLPAVPG